MQALHLVVGSGPAGVSCAIALLARGCRVEMIDAGLDLEADTSQQLSSLQSVPASLWTAERVAFLKGKMAAGVDGIPLKLAYGSDYPYRLPQGAVAVECKAADSKPSYAMGGLSNVWGASILPYREQDMQDWPESTRDLSAHYKAVARFMPVAARRDELESEFPSYSDQENPLPLSPQAQAIASDWKRTAHKLAAAGVRFGQSRLAVNAAGTGKAGACTRCGLCMYGCPYRLIWSSAETVECLKAHPRFTYRPGLMVTKVSEASDEAVIEAQDASGEQVQIRGARIYLAAGVLATATILMRSLNLYGTPVEMKDSQYFLLPMLRKKSAKQFRRDDLHTLAQLFLEVTDPEVSPFTVHLQAYTYNELFEQPVAKMLGPFYAVFPATAFFSRLFLFQGYLHSNHSSPISLTLEKSAAGDKLCITGSDAPKTNPVLRGVVRKLLALNGPLGAFPLTPLLRPGLPGRGFHSGGVFPMRDRPSSNTETDVYGRPAGLRRIHAVDSSVMPSIAATTVTFTAMANAHRIGTVSAELED